MTHKINDKQACTNKNKVCEMHLYIIFYNNKCNFSFHHHEPSDQHARQESNKKKKLGPVRAFPQLTISTLLAN